MGFYTCAYYNSPQKIWQTIGKLETNVVIDKTRVGSAVFAFHGRNCLNILNSVNGMAMKHLPDHVPTRLS